MQLTIKQFCLALLVTLMALPAQGTERSAKARYAFRKANPCPAENGTRYGACPGWIIDHIVPLCAGGADEPSNMQWQTKEAALEKDKEEWKLCRSIGKM